MSSREIEFAVANNARDVYELASFLKQCAEDRWPQLIEKLRVHRPQLFLRHSDEDHREWRERFNAGDANR